jgi:signal peptidase I
MNDYLLLSDDDIAAELRSLAREAAPAVTTQPDLADRVLTRSRTDRRDRTRRVAILAGAGLLAVAAAAAARPGGGTHFSVIQPSAAMIPTVKVSEQVVFHKRLHPQRGDVVYAHVTAPGFGHPTISRVVAVAGDIITCPADTTGQCSTLVVNGQAVSEPYLGPMAVEPFGPLTVPVGATFLMGDARSNATETQLTGTPRA